MGSQSGREAVRFRRYGCCLGRRASPSSQARTWREVRFPDGSSRAGRPAPPVERTKFNDHPRSPIHGAAAPRRSGASIHAPHQFWQSEIRHNRRAGSVAECPKSADALLVNMAGVGLEAAALTAAFGRAAAQAAADNPGKAHSATATAATAAARIRANATEGKSSSHEKSRKRSFDRWTHDNLSFSVHQLCRDCRSKLPLLQC